MGVAHSYCYKLLHLRAPYPAVHLIPLSHVMVHGNSLSDLSPHPTSPTVCPIPLHHVTGGLYM